MFDFPSPGDAAGELAYAAAAAAEIYPLLQRFVLENTDSHDQQSCAWNVEILIDIGPAEMLEDITAGTRIEPLFWPQAPKRLQQLVRGAATALHCLMLEAEVT